MAFTCRSTGDGNDLEPCDLGCSDIPTPHCKYLQPKYMPEICDTEADSDLMITTSGSLDPNVDTTCTGGVVAQGGADLCVIHAHSIVVAESSMLTITGSTGMSGRAIAFVADDNLSVAGSIDASGHIGVNGPGGGTFVSGGTGGLNSQTNTLTAAGGAGGATAGGAGATSTASGGGTDGGGANGGAPVMNPALLASFVGGASTPRADGGPTMPDPSYGGGGGALMLVSCKGSVAVTGILNAGGGGGDAGVVASGGGFGLPFPPRGGGAGGNIVVQGRNVSITGSVFANGGGGGEGWQPTTGVKGESGKDGAASDISGGAGGRALGGAGYGGNGGWIGVSALQGQHPSAMGGGAGAGGGSVGFLRTYTPPGVDPMLTPAHVSPAFQPNGTVELR